MDNKWKDAVENSNIRHGLYYVVPFDDQQLLYGYHHTSNGDALIDVQTELSVDVKQIPDIMNAIAEDTQVDDRFAYVFQNFTGQAYISFNDPDSQWCIMKGESDDHYIRVNVDNGELQHDTAVLIMASEEGEDIEVNLQDFEEPSKLDSLTDALDKLSEISEENQL